jgi:hypothetical protein
MRFGRSFKREVAAAAALALTGACVAHQPPAPVLTYIAGTPSAEDLVALPGTKWLIASGLLEANRAGGITLVDREARRAVRAEPVPALDSAAYPDCTGPYDPARLSVHGLNLRPDRSGGTLYAVGHGGREAVEVFRVTMGPSMPRLAWIGCVPVPPGAIANGVVPLPEGGIAATLMIAPEFARPASAGASANPMARMAAGETTGYAALWRPGAGWSKIDGTEGSGPNGIEVSPDGRWLWIALWGSRQVIRVPVDGMGEKAVLELAVWPDNLRWGDDGALWVAGAADVEAYMACRQQPGCRADYRIARIDPASLKVEDVPVPAATSEFGDATTAAFVDGDLWLAAYPTDRLAVLEGAR